MAAAVPPEVSPPRIGAMQALIVTLALIPLVGAYLAIGFAIGLEPLFAGFLFSLYWGAFKGMALPEFWPALAGSLAGLGLAALMHVLPLHIGIAGMAIALLLIVAAVYLYILQAWPFVANHALLLFLTVGTIPALQAQADFAAMAAAVLLGAAYCGGLALLMGKISGRGTSA